MGLGSSKSKASKSTKHVVKSNKRSSKQKLQRSESEDSDLNDDDVNLVTVPLDTSVTDKRLSKAKELIASGRPISISLEATTEEPAKPATGKDGKAIWEDDEAREKWKDQLSLMRHFYDWDEIPFEFFVDSYVGGGGEAVRRRRLSLNLVTEPLPNPNHVNQHLESKTPEPDRRIIPKPHPQPSASHHPLPHQRVTPPDAVSPSNNRTRAASVAVTDHSRIPAAATSKNLPLATFVEEAPIVAVSQLPVIKQAPPELPQRKIRAASVALGESFPVGTAAAIQSAVCNPQTPRHIQPSEEDVKRLSLAASKTPKRNPVDALKESEAPMPTRERSTSRADPLANIKDEESRPRRPSATSIDQVYGRLGKPGGAYDRFEMENPVLHGSPQQPRRQTVSDNKKPEQFKNLGATIDPTQFATERRNTRVSIHRSGENKPLYDEGRTSTTSTRLVSKTSSGENARGRTMSDWM